MAPSTSIVVITVTTQFSSATATSSSHASSALPSNSIAGIIIGALLAVTILIVLIVFLLNRHKQRQFSKVANSTDDHMSALEGAQQIKSTTSTRSKYPSRHGQKPSTSAEPLIPPVSWPSPALSPGTLSRSGFSSPGVGESQFGSDLGEINTLVPSDAPSALLNTPPFGMSPDILPESLRRGSPHAQQTFDGSSTLSMSQKYQQSLFLHRMLQSRAQASEVMAPSHRPSLDLSQILSPSQESSDIFADVERLLAEAERTALRDAEMARREKGQVDEVDLDMDDGKSVESIYSQNSAPLDHGAFFTDPVSRQNSTSSLARRRSSRRQARAPAPTDLTPVAEMPDTTSEHEGQNGLLPAANPPSGEHVSDGTSSVPMTSVAFPLLTSANFGKESTTASGSLSSTAGWGSGSSGQASRYPSLAASSIGQSSRSGQRSDDGTDWRHPPTGLAALSTLQIGVMQNPHSPVPEQPEPPEESPRSEDASTPRLAHLRAGTRSSLPEVERRNVVQGGIAHIDVTL